MEISAAPAGGILKQLHGQQFEEQDMEPDHRTDLAGRFMTSRRHATGLTPAPPGPRLSETAPEGRLR
ncbi:hypothetical protein B1987_09015 [Mycobacterium kansasii]|uniref:Uncharacterized protein n=1 Tax=Mycobacterium attenuatum TaxID=2341086 RepID=A0A498QCC0_9MYCO|nr:hypothetical protein [Mycobacterium attenuatum]ORB83913.1 hypothetical protein B1987_09015 [Mycobacterium kansasii]VBA42192.1 hypothetical protein LAUMK136_04454 [Mycobacterium attenuatum]VBA58243.1 hypothetical protein LAUMK191_04448 [Mycobacterium attenuatum]VBA61190.1 hypothetical protein LAUMK41_04564 [Mycobacterium attenuatum]